MMILYNLHVMTDQGQGSYGPAGGGHHPAGGNSYYGNHTGGKSSG